MKGISGAIMAVIFLVVIISVVGVFAVYYAVMLAVPRVAPVAPTYDGEFDDAFLATKWAFYSDFTEQTDCNITSDVLGYNWASCIYRTRIAWNATADTSIDSRDWVLDIAFDIDGAVGPGSEIDIDTGAGTSSTGKPVDDSALTEVILYTHEDDPTEIIDLTRFIDDQEDLDNAEVGPLAGDEYVLHVVWHTKSVSPAFTTGDDIARISFDLDTTEDVDTAQILVESA